MFNRHPKAEVAPTNFWEWAGESGQTYPYEIYPVDADFSPMPGNYIYARQLEDGAWVPVYISQTRDLHQRLEGNVRLHDAIANGATHLHVHYCAVGHAARCSEERDLIARWHPICNEVASP